MANFDALNLSVFWSCVAVVAYAYLGYPVLIWCLSRVLGRPPRPVVRGDEDLPTVSLLIAAKDEEAVIARRLGNALAMDYPADKLEILVGSDGSTDRTAEIIRRFSDRGVRLLEFDRNRGKASTLNDLANEARGEILLMSDANTNTDPGAARKIVRWFDAPRVGAVVGRLVLVDSQDHTNVDGMYWRYETHLKRCESRLDAVLGANGAIYAIRKALYEPLPARTIIDDFVIPLRAKLRTGCSIVYEPEAIAVEETSPGIGPEFWRRVRIGAGNYQALGLIGRLLHPRHGWLGFALLSHKVARWLCPFFLIGAMVSSLFLWNRPFFRAFVIALIAVTVAATYSAVVPARHKALRPLRLVAMFGAMNVALMIGFWRGFTGRQQGAWRRTLRVDETEKAVP
jgi:cellulose synthase/poly-beta-1,6-N-acetylglucosamine synthase-like glycosyltransferase